MDDVERLQLIEDYVFGHLDKEQTLAFEERLKVEPALYQELDLYKNLIKGVELEAKLNSFRRQMDSFDQGLVQEKSGAKTVSINKNQRLNKPGIKIRRFIQWSSGIAVAVVICLFLFVRSDTGTQLYSKYYQPYPGGVQLSILRGSDTQSLEQKAIQAYDNHNYREAARLMEAIRKNDPDNVVWLFYSGIAYMELNSLQQAGLHLQAVSRHPESILYKQGLWYLALVHVKKGETKEAKVILEKLSKESGTYGEKAKELLKEL